MTSINIVRSTFKALRKDNLATYAENVVKNCNGNPAYSMVQPLVTRLESEVLEYRTALVAAESGAYSDRARKRIAQPKVLVTLDEIAKSLSFHGTDEKFAIDAGFDVVSKRQLTGGILQAPLLTRVQPTGNRGEVILHVKAANSRMVQTYAVEFSPDEGANWQNGRYGKGRKLLLSGLPSQPNVQFRVHSIGTFGRVSAWSTVITQNVL